MRDFPIFMTPSGVASITLSQIPYTKRAYVRIQKATDPEKDLEACASFCYAAGAEKISVTGHSFCENYPLNNRILLLQADKSRIGETDAALFPMTEKTWGRWRDIYNQKSTHIPNAAWLSLFEGERYLADGDCYFVHRDQRILGIGKASGDQISFIASLEKGAGADVLAALCHGITGDIVQVEVADRNEKAVIFYRDFGFIPVRELAKWYEYVK